MRCILIFLVLVQIYSAPGAEEEKPVLFAGESPSRVYALVHRARQNIDVDTVLACTSRRVGLTQESAYKQLMDGRGTLPRTIDVLDEKRHGQIATLELQGLRRDRETRALVTSTGTVTLVKEDGTWRIRHETWKDGPSSSPPPPADDAKP